MKNIVQGSIITTFRCNAKCHMCDIWKYPTIPSEEINPKLLEKLPDGLRINITGGEPTIRKDIDDFFEILYPKSNLLELSTNGYNTDKIVGLAEKFPNILIRVSIEGLPKLNDKLRGLPDGFDRALRTILELKKTKCKNIGFSVVICDKNAQDLVKLHELCSYLGVELGNSVMHNSWYFHKFDNFDEDREKAVRMEKQFISSLLQSPRNNIKGKLKDYGRAYFNKSILKRLAGDESNYRPPCGAGEDFFFIDPWGNLLPCNGSDKKWIIGNLNDASFEELMTSRNATKIMQKVKACKKDCCFIVTERHDMVRKPWKPIYWIAKNKLKLAFNIQTDFL
ncbi:MAG: radical SAM protein [Desulfobacteraceae bacterium]|nr:radical SAM protein [Desulfobacteraceae bacterium]